MADSFWFWSNYSSMDHQDHIEEQGGGGGRGFDIEGHQEQEIMLMRRSMMKNVIGGGGGGRGYNDEGQEQEMLMRRSMMMKVDDFDLHQDTIVNATATKKPKGGKRGGGGKQKKNEKKNPRRGVGIAKLEETIKQKNVLKLAEEDRQVYHGFPTTAVLPTTHNDHNQSQSQSQIPFHRHYPSSFLDHQQRKQTSTISSSVVHGANNTQLALDMNHEAPNTNISKNRGYDHQVSMNYASAINVNGGQDHQDTMNYGSNANGGHDHQLTINSHSQPFSLFHPSKPLQQQHGVNTFHGGAGYHPSAGSGVRDDQHGINTYNGAGYNSSTGSGVPDGNNNGAASGFYELSSTQKQQQHYHADHISLNNKQKNLNNGENIGFTRYSGTNINAQIIDREEPADFLELDLGRKWNNNDSVDGHIKKDSKAALGGLLRAGYSGLAHNDDDDDQVELLAVHRKGKSSPGILMEYEFLSSTVKGGHHHGQYHHTARGGGTKKQYEQHYSSSSCIMEESAAASSSVRNYGSSAAAGLISYSSSAQSNSTDHDFLDLSLKLSYH